MGWIRPKEKEDLEFHEEGFGKIEPCECGIIPPDPDPEPEPEPEPESEVEQKELDLRWQNWTE